MKRRFGTFDFELIQERPRKWIAKVYRGMEFMGYVSARNERMEMPSRKKLIAWIQYAYEGKEFA